MCCNDYCFPSCVAMTTLFSNCDKIIWVVVVVDDAIKLTHVHKIDDPHSVAVRSTPGKLLPSPKNAVADYRQPTKYETFTTKDLS